MIGGREAVARVGKEAWWEGNFLSGAVGSPASLLASIQRVYWLYKYAKGQCHFSQHKCCVGAPFLDRICIFTVFYKSWADMQRLSEMILLARR